MSSKRSALWTYFKVHDAKKCLSICLVCGNMFSYKSSISNLKKHIVTRHRALISLKQFKTNSDSHSYSSTKLHEVPSSAIPSPEMNSNNLNSHSVDKSNSSIPQIKPGSSILSLNLEKLKSQAKYRSESSAVKKKPSASISRSYPEANLRSKKVKLSKDSSEIVPGFSSGATSSNTHHSIVDIMIFDNYKGFDYALLQLFYVDMQPFSFLSHNLLKFFSALNPQYIVPDVKTISTSLLPDLYNKVKRSVSLFLDEAAYVTLSSELWTNEEGGDFFALTASFIDEDFRPRTIMVECGCIPSAPAEDFDGFLRHIASKSSIENKVILNVTSDMNRKLEENYIKCFACTINLVVNCSICEIQNVIGKVKNVIKFVTDFSSEIKDKARKEWLTLEKMKLYKQLNGISTTWTSLIYVFSNLIMHKDVIGKIWPLLDVKFKDCLPTLSSADWENIQAVVKVLRPFLQIAETMNKEKYIPCSTAFIIITGLQDVYSKLIKDSRKYDPCVRDLITSIAQKLKERFGKWEHNECFLRATFFDPRFKHILFKPKTKKTINDWATEKVAALIKSGAEDFSSPSTSKTEGKYSVWDFIQEKASQHKVPDTVTKAQDEVQRYLDEPLLPRDRDPLNWWKINGYMYPNLKKLMPQYFPLTVNSAPCGRFYSKEGIKFCERRSRLTKEETTMFVYLNQNRNFGLPKDSSAESKGTPKSSSNFGLDSNLFMVATDSDMVVEVDPDAFGPPDTDVIEIDPLSQPGPSSRLEPDSSMLEDTPSGFRNEPDSPLVKIKQEYEDSNILSATVEKELNSFSKESPTCNIEDNLFQPPVLIKEEPVSSEEEEEL